MNKKIGILGCGWLGLPLAKALIADQYRVNGTTTSSQKLEMLSDAGIGPFLISLSEDGTAGDLCGFIGESDTLIVNIPPNLRAAKKENFINKIQHLAQAIRDTGLTNLIFIGSTSVYGDITGHITEEALPRPNTESGQQLLEAERILKNIPGPNTTIIRFGGLIGPDRHPITHLAGRKNLPNGDERVNLIHLDDCIGLIRTILTKNYWNRTINGVYPYHPTKKEYYTLEATKKGLFPPCYISDPIKKEYKTIGNSEDNVKIYPYTTTIIS